MDSKNTSQIHTLRQIVSLPLRRATCRCERLDARAWTRLVFLMSASFKKQLPGGGVPVLSLHNAHHTQCTRNDGFPNHQAHDKTSNGKSRKTLDIMFTRLSRRRDDRVTGTLSTVYLSEASSARFCKSFIERFVEVLVRFTVVFVTPLRVRDTSVFMLPHAVQHTA